MPDLILSGSPTFHGDSSCTIDSTGTDKVKAPASLLDEAQGWVTFRMQMPWSSAAGPPGSFPAWFSWVDNASNYLFIYYHHGDKEWAFKRIAGGSVSDEPVTLATTWSAGDDLTLTVAWTTTSAKGWVNAANSRTSIVGNVPSLAASTFDIGADDGFNYPNIKVWWFACGTGPLTDADAAYLHAFGNSDPSNPFTLPGDCKMVWPAVSAAYLLPIIPTIPTIIVPKPEFKEFKVIHLNHAFQELGECFPNSLSFSLPLSAVGDISYELSMDDNLAIWQKTYPYRTDYLLMLGDRELQAGIHTGVAINDVESETLQISGNDYLHYLELRWYPFDPLNLAAGGFIAPVGADIFSVVEDLLDATLAQTNSLALAYANGLSGQVINDFKIEMGDTEHIKGKIETLSKKLPGFDYEVTPQREFKMYPDGKGTVKSFTFEQGKNIYLLDYANRGPEGTHTLGVVQGSGNKIARTVDHPGIVTYRRLDVHEDLQIITTDANIVQKAAEAESERNGAPRTEFSAKFIGDEAIEDIFDEVETGDKVMVHVDLGWDEIHDYMRIINIQGTSDDEGNMELTFTFDDGTLAQ